MENGTVATTTVIIVVVGFWVDMTGNMTGE
jgi:hypothetical protein